MNETTERPVFALPNAILMPGIMLPLHVFEPRYKRMIDDCLRSGSELTVAWAPETGGSLQPSSVCGTGRLRVMKNYADGRKDLIVTGKHRIRLGEKIRDLPYPVYETEPLELVRLTKKEEAAALKELRESFARWVFLGFNEAGRLIHYLNSVSRVDPLCNFIAYYFGGGFEDKQKVLEMDDLSEKLAFTLDFVQNHVDALEKHLSLLRSDKGGNDTAN